MKKYIKLKSYIAIEPKTQSTFAKQLGIEQQTLSTYLNGHRPLPMRHWKKAANVLSISLDQLKALLEPEE